MERRSLPSAWEEMVRTASAVRATPSATECPMPGRPAPAVRPIVMTGRAPHRSGIGGAAPGGTTGSGHRQRQRGLAAVLADQPGPHQQRRAFAHVQRHTSEHRRGRAVQLQTGSACTGAPIDMIRRNYFAHPILGCGQFVFSMMQAYGVHYRSAGENIGWEARLVGALRATSTASSWPAPTIGPTSSTATTPRWVSGPTRAHRG